MSFPALPTRIELDPQQATPANGARPEQSTQGGAAFARMLADPAASTASAVRPDAPALPADSGDSGDSGDVVVQGVRDVLADLLEAPQQMRATEPKAVAAPDTVAAAAQAADLAEILRATASADTRAAPDGSGSLSRLLGILQVLHGVAPGMALAGGGDQAPAASAATLMQALGVAEAAADAAGAGRAASEGSAARAAEAALGTLGPTGNAPVASSPATTTMPSMPISAPAGGPDWAEALGQRMLWMVRGKVQSAELRLNPPEMGAVEVRVRMDEDGLRLSFNTATAGARDALEQAAPRLREMLQSEGFSLAGFDVERHGSGEPGKEEMATSGDADTMQLVEDGEESFLAQPSVIVARGLVDTFV